MLHMEYNHNLATWMERSPQTSPTLSVALQLHEHTYVHLGIPRPMAHPRCEPQFGQTTASPKVFTQALADTGAQVDVLTLGTLSSLGIDPRTLIEVQVRAGGAVQGSQLDIKGGIFLAVRSTDSNEYRKAVRLFYVASNVAQNYLSRACHQALSVVSQDFPRIGAASSGAPWPSINGNSPSECPARTLGPRNIA